MPKVKSNPKATKLELIPHIAFVPWDNNGVPAGEYIQFCTDANNTQPTFKFGKRKAQSILSALEANGVEKFKACLKRVIDFKKEEE